MSEYKQAIIKLIESDISGYQIHKETGLSQTVISGLRTGSRDLENLNLKSAEKLYEYAKAHLNK
ncbi:hypothetical protein BUY79_02315 [Staphylococcus equorum]|uniref:hypothetical protein n=1 Tax=Staphylococcus equorum TaxID=246432 RepID=UPI000D1CB823|nr:hypothetical protein [Staphylococcus equorum]PTE42206.1 hypothetical protein BUY77_10785 [Staphylococcus equorum]PTE85602.1 hypothetical protein BUY79_02315 [Staphylococcus equorum]PTF11177.1 hypothetical protein BUY81_07485 [Staphylococcus equorum]RIL48272.1 hypothetical protein BUY82_05685 [Staphylococcus equorum]